MNVFISGCAGFIGAHLTKKLLGKNHKIIGIDNLNNYYNPCLKKARLEKLIGFHKNFKFLQVDLIDKKYLDRIFSKNHFDFVIHLAAQAGVRYSLKNPFIYQKSNIEGTLNLLEAIRHHQSQAKLIFASSSSVYGKSKMIPFKEKDPCDQPISLYSATKRANELMIKTYNHLFGIKAACLRFFTVYGPWGRPDMAYYLFTKKIFEGKKIDVYEKNTQRDFTYIDDIIDALEKILSKNFNFEIINLGDSHPVSLNMFIKILEKEIGKKAKINIKRLPPGDIKKTFADISKAKKLLGWKPKTDLKEGLKNFVRWYKKEVLNNPSFL